MLCGKGFVGDAPHHATSTTVAEIVMEKKGFLLLVTAWPAAIAERAVLVAEAAIRPVIWRKCS